MVYRNNTGEKIQSKNLIHLRVHLQHELSYLDGEGVFAFHDGCKWRYFSFHRAQSLFVKTLFTSTPALPVDYDENFHHIHITPRKLTNLQQTTNA